MVYTRVGATDRKGAGPSAVHHGIENMLVAAGADVNLQDHNGFTALMYAVGAGRVSIVKLLLAAGALPNIVNANGDTALHIACRMGIATMVTDLLNAGADIKQLDALGRTPLVIAGEALKASQHATAAQSTSTH